MTMLNPAQFAQRRPQGNSESNPESGIVLLMVIFLTFLLLLSLAIAAPEWAHQMQRQKDIETIHRGQQYERAIQLYYRKFNRYPNTVKQLLNSNDIRFLRQQYKDPLTGKDDWKLVLYGHAHVHPLGLFGKPLAVLGAVQTSGGMYAISGSSSSGASGAPSAAASGAAGNGMGSSDSIGSSDDMGFGGSNTSLSSSDSGSIFGGSTAGSTTTGSTSINGSGSSSSPGSPSSSGSGSDSGFQTNAPFVGVVPPMKKKSTVDYRAQDNYARWEFNYDPAIEQLKAQVSILGGSQNDLNGSTSLNGDSTTATSGSPFGNSGGLGTTSSGTTGSGSANSGTSGSSSSGNSDDLFGSSQ